MSIEQLLEQITETHPAADISLLRALIGAVRPAQASQTEHAAARLCELCGLLNTQPRYCAALREYLIEIVQSRKAVHLFTDTGITLHAGFWSTAWQRLLFKLLPPLINNAYLRDVFGQLFDRVDDHVWINAIDEQIWMALLQALDLQNVYDSTHPNGSHAMQNELLSALQVLSYRISAIGLESELVRNYPAIELHESPFLRQNDEINAYISEYQQWLLDRHAGHRDSQHIDVLLTQCEEIIAKIRRTAAVAGVSVSLTRLLLSVTQSIARLRHLLDLIEAPDRQQMLRSGLALFKELVEADNHKYSIADLIKTNTDLLTIQVTEHASRSGEHYVATSRREWIDMFRSASGAGLIVGFMAMIKILFGKLLLAPFGFAFLFSLNYSLGFMLVHILHCTIATKQPAMTAAHIARTLDQNSHNLDDLCDLVIQVIRTQFIAILGNVALAMPVAWLLALGWHAAFGQHLVDPVKAQHLLTDINPLASLSLFHAAIAGVCLFLSGLISGYYDNKASYSKIPERLLQLSGMQALFGAARWQRVTDYIGNNLGALAGNFYFGVMLGSIGQVGLFLGLPIDIRHITFSSANFAFALVGLDHQLSLQVWLVSLLGIVLIGIVNLAVSFSLALFVAMRSRNVSFEKSGALLALLWQRFTQRKRDFFVPPKENHDSGDQNK